jgi:hypothetical protein
MKRNYDSYAIAHIRYIIIISRLWQMVTLLCKISYYITTDVFLKITMNVYNGTLRALQCALLVRKIRRKRVEQPGMQIVSPPTKMLEAISPSTKTLEAMWWLWTNGTIQQRWVHQPSMMTKICCQEDQWIPILRPIPHIITPLPACSSLASALILSQNSSKHKQIWN